MPSPGHDRATLEDRPDSRAHYPGHGPGRAPVVPAQAPPGTTRAPAGMTWPLDGARPERLARRVVADVLSALSISPGRRDDAELAIQELVVNARLYAPGPYELCVRPCDTAVTLAVTDGGGDHAAIEGRLCGEPAAAVPASAERGRGLQIVAALFPGACGAGPAERPAPGHPDRAAAKQVWISVPLDG